MELQGDALTAEEVATMLQINKNTVYTLAKRGDLGSYRIGRKLRFTPEDVQEYINVSKNNAGQITTANKPSEDLSARDRRLFEARPSHHSSRFVLAGSNMILDILANYLQALGITCGRDYGNSYQNLVGMYLGRIDAAAISLWDSSSDSDNIPFVKALTPGMPVKVLHVASFTQGLLVKKGNPHNLRSWLNVLDLDIILANREKGSAPRVLLDEHLRMLETDPLQIKGYTREITSPLVQATMIAKGEAHVGIGEEKLMHQVEGIDYLPLQAVCLAIVVAKRPEAARFGRPIQACLNNSAFVSELQNMVGYDFSGIGKCIYET